MAARIEALKTIFPPTSDSVTHENTLSVMLQDAPMSFELNWKITKDEISKSKITERTETAIQALATLIGWATIEAFWREASIVLGPRIRLAGIALDINLELSDEEIISVIRTNSMLFKKLLLSRFEKQVNGGLETIANINNAIDQKIVSFQERLKDSEVHVTNIVTKIDGYVSDLEKYRTQFAFLGLSGAFRNFFKRKQIESWSWGAGAFILALLMVFVAAFSHVIAYKLENIDTAQLLGSTTSEVAPNKVTIPSKDISINSESPNINTLNTDKKAQPTHEPDHWINSVTKYFPILGFEILLLYFFRFTLLHFNASKAQLLQLEVRMAICAFIEDYAKFTKENGGQDLSKFESMIFSAIAPDNEKMPSTFDGVDQLATFIKNIRNS